MHDIFSFPLFIWKVLFIKLNSLLLLDKVSLTKGPALTVAARNTALPRLAGEKLLPQRGENMLSWTDNQGIGCKALFNNKETSNLRNLSSG